MPAPKRDLKAEAAAILDQMLSPPPAAPPAPTPSDAITPEAIVAAYRAQLAGVRRMVDTLISDGDVTQARHLKELIGAQATLDRALKEAHADLPPAEDADPASHRAAIVAYVKGLPQDDPLRASLQAVLAGPPRPPQP